MSENDDPRAFLTPEERQWLEARDAQAAAEIAADIEKLGDPKMKIWGLDKMPSEEIGGLPPDLKLIMGMGDEEGS